MRSGSSAQDGSGWPSAHHPHQNEAVSGPGPYGSGPRSDPRDDPAGRGDVPFGPNISWPNGFRRLDTESRRVLESGYAPAGDYRSGPYDRVDPRYGAGSGSGSRPGYKQPAMEDYGYGDPGYSDPSYDGPRNPYTGPMFALGHRGSPVADGYALRDARTPRYPAPPAGGQGMYPATGSGEVYPITGAQEALPATGPQPVAGFWAGPVSGDPGSRGYPDGRYETPRSGVRLPEGLRYDDPRLDGGRPGLDDPRATAGRPGRPADPRLEGIRYDELRYDEPAYDDEPSYGASRYDQPADDVTWYEELRRSAPVYPDRPNGPASGGPSAGGPPSGGHRPADPPRHVDPRVPSHGQQAGYPQLPVREQPSGYGQVRDDRGGSGPQMRAGREVGTGPVPRPGLSRQHAPQPAQPVAFQDRGFREAPTAQVGVLTPPSGGRVYVPQEDTAIFTTAPGTGQILAPAVRPGHGLDGPEITSSWPAQPQTDDPDSFEDFWQQDDKDEEYRGLFSDGDDDFGDQAAASRQAAVRRTGRRRGRSSDHRLWLALAGVVIAASAAITAIIKFEFPSHGGPVHTMVTPARIGTTYLKTADMERQINVAQLREEVIQMSAGQASDVKSAVYEAGNSAAGNTEQIVMFIGGHLANAAPAASIADFTQKFAGATVVSAGSLGGQAACVEEGAATSNAVSMCVWFDNDSFGEIVSPTMNATTLAKTMLTVRPDLEIVVKN
jgi:hypothetical protein